VPYFPLKIWAFETPSSLEFPSTFLGVGMDIFWNYTFANHSNTTSVSLF